MKILVHSYVFAPSIGGIERVSEVLCRQFFKLGHTVTLVTQTAANNAHSESDYPFNILRNPTRKQWIHLARHHDVLWQNNISLPGLLLSRPFMPSVITMQTWLGNHPEARNWNVVIKRQCHRLGRGVAISSAIAARMPGRPAIIPNPFDADSFQEQADKPEVNPRQLLFVGRLVSDKGVDLLLEAMTLIPPATRPTLTVVGDGPERPQLEAQAMRTLQPHEVAFLGALEGEQLHAQFHRHAIMVIPSRWPEPFGVVALEAIASGCMVVATKHGGLPEAVGPCGLLVPPNDPNEFARALERINKDPSIVSRCQEKAPEHLKQFEAAHIAELYLDQFKLAMGGVH